jgi:hypothetical protein
MTELDAPTSNQAARLRADILGHLRTPLYRNGYALMVSTALASGLGLVYWTLAARLYTPDAVGINSAIISVMIFLSGVAQLNLLSVMIRYLPVAGRASGRLIGIAYLVSITLAVLVGLIFLLGVELWAPSLNVLKTDPWLGVWFIGGMCVWCVFALQDYVLTGLRRTMWVPFENIIYAVVKILLLVVFASSLNGLGIFASWTLPLLFALIPINLLIFRRFLPQHVRATAEAEQPLIPREIGKYIAGNYFGQIAALAVARLLPLIVIMQVGASANAYFFLPWTLAVAMRLLSSDMVMSLTVEGARQEWDLGNFAFRFFKHLARVVLPLVALVLIAAPFLLSFAGPEYAAEGTLLLRLLALSTLPAMITSLYVGVARVQRRVVGIFGAQVVPGVLMLVTSYLLLPQFGITAVGIAALASESLVAFILVLLERRIILRLLTPKAVT